MTDRAGAWRETAASQASVHVLDVQRPAAGSTTPAQVRQTPSTMPAITTSHCPPARPPLAAGLPPQEHEP